MMHKVRECKILVWRGSRYINVTLLAIQVSKYQTGSSAPTLFCSLSLVLLTDVLSLIESCFVCFT
jgi:hypothetical protein